MIAGGKHEDTPFYNTDPVNSYEFFPPKDGNVPRPSAFLKRSLPANLFPRKVKFEFAGLYFTKLNYPQQDVRASRWDSFDDC